MRFPISTKPQMKIRSFIIILSAGLLYGLQAQEIINYSNSYGFQTYTISQDGFYQISAAGGSGGNTTPDGNPGGEGGVVSGLISLSAGSTLYMVVASAGSNGTLQPNTVFSNGLATYPCAGGGGGGGTFVFLNLPETNWSVPTPLLVAGGGGGAGVSAGLAGGSSSAGGGNGGAYQGGGSQGGGGGGGLTNSGILGFGDVLSSNGGTGGYAIFQDPLDVNGFHNGYKLWAYGGIGEVTTSDLLGNMTGGNGGYGGGGGGGPAISRQAL